MIIRGIVFAALVFGVTSASAVSFDCAAVRGFTSEGRIYLEECPDFGLIPNFNSGHGHYVELKPISQATWMKSDRSVQFSMPPERPLPEFTTFTARITTSIGSFNLHCFVTRER